MGRTLEVSLSISLGMPGLVISIRQVTCVVRAASLIMADTQAGRGTLMSRGQVDGDLQNARASTALERE